jgi:NADH-quinone oxidoreductase subunit L
MLATVTLVSLVVAIYSVGYMHGDPGYWRFFTYISLFVFSMTMLVSVSNFALLYVFWEGVGLCSYLLIGFWFQRPEAAAAGKKAFLVNRVGDFGFALAVFLIWIAYGTLDFHGVLGPAAAGDAGRVVGGAVGTAICLLLLLGACGKSAQLPLHVWLPDAMEGPTPVSALIHAATMVTAGVYLVARCAPLFAASPGALHAVAAVGGLTALMAAVIAMTQNDLKRILAYSTISQLGYMFLALGTGTALGVVAAMFHLVTHAFFKGLLFLGAGSVMHAMGGVVDIRRLGGLRRRMPVTCWTYLFGSLALAGVIPWAGFWSKDAILAAVSQPSPSAAVPAFYHGLFWIAVATAGLTAFYTFRAFFLVFSGPERIPPEAGGHARESSRWMTLPLVFLALAAIDVGIHLELTGSLRDFLARAPSIVSLGGLPHAAEAEAVDWTLVGASTAVVLLGIALAWLVYRGAPACQRWLVPLMESSGLYRLSSNKFYFDEVYRRIVVRPLELLAQTSAWLDRWLIDGLVDLIGTAPKGAGALLRPLQGGLVQFYAAAMVVGLAVLLGMLLIL